ncbi:MAG: SDR family NAD(P)-dependent oxidoreductase [Huintestinicola sp.]
MSGLIDLTEKKIMITGASSGIGKAAARLAAECGASLVLCGRNEERLKETLDSLPSPDKHITIPFDVTDTGKYEQVFRAAVSDGAKLSGMVHCAGIAEATPLRLMKYEDIRDIMDVNYTSFMLLTAFYSKKKYSCGGSIVGISAANAHCPQQYMSVYAASKAAIEASVKTLAVELAKMDIRINCVVPGAVDTPMAERLDGEALGRITARHLLGMRSPEDIANFILFLLSDASAAVTGRTVFADGGLLGQSN